MPGRRPGLALRAALLALLAGAITIGVVALVAYGPSSPPGRTPSPRPSATLPSQLGSFRTSSIWIGGDRLAVAVAESPSQWTQGLQNLRDLGPLDGMLFAFPEPVTTQFWMKETLIPLDIAFFDASGHLVLATTMRPCTADPCPTYGPTRAYRWAVEVPAGRFTGLSPAAVLSLAGPVAPTS